jgi:hypothetical protein
VQHILSSGDVLWMRGQTLSCLQWLPRQGKRVQTVHDHKSVLATELEGGLLQPDVILPTQLPVRIVSRDRQGNTVVAARLRG